MLAWARVRKGGGGVAAPRAVGAAVAARAARDMVVTGGTRSDAQVAVLLGHARLHERRRWWQRRWPQGGPLLAMRGGT